MTHSEIFEFEPFVSRAQNFKPLKFSVIGLAHSHIYGMTMGLLKAGAILKNVYEDNEELLKSYLKTFPQAKAVKSEEEILEDNEIMLIASADIPVKRASLAVKALSYGKNFFTDKAPLISLTQLDEVKKAVEETGKGYFVYYGESIDNESAVFAKQLIDRGVIGKVFHIDSMAPHRLNPHTRSDWFFKKEFIGGILTDLGSHQTQQFLSYTSNKNAKIDMARVANYNFKEYSQFEDFADFTLTGDNGVTGYFRIDWNSPLGLNTWGDARMQILGDKGYIELRKNCNVGVDCNPNHIIVVTDDGQFVDNVSGKVGITYFDDLIYDCYNKTQTAMSTEQAFKAIELAITAQSIADKNKKEV